MLKGCFPDMDRKNDKDSAMIKIVNNGTEKFNKPEEIVRYGETEWLLYQFMKNTPDWWERINAAIFFFEFDDLFNDLRAKVDKISDAKEVLDPSKVHLKLVLATILRIGNYLNAGKKKGQSYGFAIENLGLLTGMKCERTDLEPSDKDNPPVKETWTLLMYILENVKKQDSEALGFLDGLAETTRKGKFNYLEKEIFDELKVIEDALNSVVKVIDKTAEQYLADRKIAVEKYRRGKDEAKEEKSENFNLDHSSSDGSKEDKDYLPSSLEPSDKNFVDKYSAFKSLAQTRFKTLLREMRNLQKDMQALAKSYGVKTSKIDGAKTVQWEEIFDVFIEFREDCMNARQLLKDYEAQRKKRKKKREKKALLTKKLNKRTSLHKLKAKQIYKTEKMIEKQKKRRSFAVRILEEHVNTQIQQQRFYTSRHISVLRNNSCLSLFCRHCEQIFRSVIPRSSEDTIMHVCWGNPLDARKKLVKKDLFFSIFSAKKERWCTFKHRGSCLIPKNTMRRPRLSSQPDFASRDAELYSKMSKPLRPLNTKPTKIRAQLLTIARVKQRRMKKKSGKKDDQKRDIKIKAPYGQKVKLKVKKQNTLKLRPSQRQEKTMEKRRQTVMIPPKYKQLRKANSASILPMSRMFATQLDDKLDSKLRGGIEVVRHTIDGRIKQEMKYVKRESMIYLSNLPEKFKITEAKELLSGKKTDIFDREGSQKINDEVCFSIIYPKETVDLEVLSKKQRDQLVNFFRPPKSFAI